MSTEGTSEAQPKRAKKNGKRPIEDRSEGTVVNRGTVGSRKSTSSSKKREELQARLELEEKELALARTKMELIQLQEIEDSSDLSEVDDEATAKPHGVNDEAVSEWVDQSSQFKNRRKQDKKNDGITDLASAIMDAIKSSKPPKSPPKYINELHYFDGDPREWISFRATYKDTETYFTDIENVARLRKAIKGQARDSVKSLMYTTQEPNEILEALERRFGRPTFLIKSEIAALEKLPSMGNDIKGIGSFASAVSNSVNTIKQMNKIEYLYSYDISEKIIEKMNIMVKFRWHEYRSTHESEPILLSLSKFLNIIADQFEVYESAPKARIKKEFTKGRPQYNKVNAACYTSDSEQEDESQESDFQSDSEYEMERKIVFAATNIQCPLCSREHGLQKCSRFETQTVKERWETVKQLKACFKCLKTNHRSINCKAKTCSKEGCVRRHHILLHSDPTPPAEPEKKESENQIVSVNHVGATRAYLKILPVELTGPKGTTTVAALLDEGSTVTLLLNEVAESIGATGPTRDLTIEGVTGHLMRTEQSKKVDLRIKGTFARNYESMTAHTIHELNLSSQQIRSEDIKNCPHLVEIADQITYERIRPALLIGQDNWHLIVTRQLKSGGANKPVASLTNLGWILHGCVTSTINQVTFVNHIAHTEAENNIENLIKQHFELDSIGISQKKPASDPEERALAILKATTRHLPEGRFECGLLWKTDNETMPQNKESAMRRLLSIERKMNKDEIFRTKYTEQINNLLKNGYAEPALAPPSSQRTWYLPHFAVVHPQKGKMRLVFDAAERTNGKSLNDALLSGPDLLQSLFGVLVRFRQGPVAVAADIKEMFLRIKIREIDRDSLRFLWREKNDQKPREFRMTSLIFGAASSPCSAIYVKNANAENFTEKYPAAVFSIKKCHYMDDFLQSFSNKKEAKEVSEQVDKIHKTGGFELRGWASNDPYVISNLQEKPPEQVPLNGHEHIEKTLGMLWHVKNDALKYTLNLRNTPEDVINGTRPPTKREVTSAIMSVFDPLGLATPVLIQGKKLIQKLWKAGTEWDETIPTELCAHWTQWMNSLDALQELDIPRCTNAHLDGELHTFVDASETAYAAAVYWRSMKNGQPSIKLLAAKAKVTPLKPISIPRLELQAALLGCRLASNIQTEIQSKITKKFYWSDSRTTLAWIKSDPRTFKTFVAHRLAEIEDATKTTEWRWVPTAHNVADDATRAVPQKFDSSHRWFNGPEFLTRDQSEWPEDKSSPNTSITGEERKIVATATPCLRGYDAPPIPNPTRFSSWKRLLRSTARLLQSVEIFKSKLGQAERAATIKKSVKDPTWRKYKKKQNRTKLEPPPTITCRTFPTLPDRLLTKAEMLLIKAGQREFKDELKALQENRPIHKRSRLGKLALTLKNDIIYLDTRISNANYLPETYKHPTVLDGHHYITKLIVMQYHINCNHGNHQTVMNELRQRYYITSLRNLVKTTSRLCQWCKVHKATPLTPPTGDLPAERLQHYQPAFTCTGVDYFGPINITIGRRVEKRWVALYTCLTTRAVHLEIAASLSADSMILTLRRMIARRGTPKVLYSDNGTNFIGADKELKKAAEERLISWKRISAGAPRMGGAWERLVRTVKVALTATLKARQPREEILHTLLLEAEHLINSRPLTEVSLDPNEPESLTPNHFLIGRSNGAINPGEFNDRDLVGPATWRTAQRLADMFWKRWLTEYLPTITPRYNTGSPGFVNPALGDIVIIVDSTLPRGVWPRGEIVQTYPGPDGKIRNVDVRTSAGVLKRPTSRLIKITEHQLPS